MKIIRSLTVIAGIQSSVHPLVATDRDPLQSDHASVAAASVRSRR
jgi:hypothetical protein